MFLKEFRGGENMSDDIQFQNMDNFKGGGNKGGLSYQEITLMQLWESIKKGSVEMGGGYWEKKTQITTSGAGIVDERYIPSTSAGYNNSLIHLRILLLPHFDKEMKKQDKEYKTALAKLDKDNPEKLHDKKVKLSQELFESLVMLAKRKNFFQERTEGEEIEKDEE